MAYIFLSFADHLNKETNIKNEFYNTSLEEQFATLQKRIPLDRQSSSFQSFIEACFPTGMTKKYYISCPNFLREKEQRESGAPSYLRNVVVRPELTLSMRRYLPDNQNIILVGDIYESNKARVLQIKGIQFIDSSMSSPNDMIVNAEACSSFSKSQSMSRMGQMITFSVWTIDRVDMSNTLFTPDFVYELIQSCYTVKNPSEIRRTFEEWNQYLNFRKYYLDEQSKRNFLLDSAEFVEAYAVNRKDYRKNSSVYDDYILDGIQDFTKGEMVVLSSKIEDAEPFPLVKLNIDRNKKSFYEARVNKRGRLVNEEERKIRSLASDNVFITSKNPADNSEYRDRNGNLQKIRFSELLNAGYALGDRFRIVSFIIQPEKHLQQLEDKYDSDIDKSYKAIDAKYEKIIKDELSKSVSLYQKEVTEEVDKQLADRKKELDASLTADVEKNTDSGILSKITKLRVEIRAKLTKETRKTKDEEEKAYKERLDSLIEEAYSEIDVKALYEERNNKTLADFEASLISAAKRQVSQYESKKNTELRNKYKDDIRNEKVAIKEQLDAQLKADKEKVIEEETIIRFSLYFRLGDSNNIITDKQIKAIKSCKYIVYDNRAEKAKITRQETALNNFYSGFVKNPYLSTYLFNPESLSSVQAEYSDWVWYLESLNEKQKEAVRKAVSSNGIFLLQGPPGTGKTQVIAETVAQMVKKGKKVLISSETHKAIDNVFERLPKIAEIVPIRLISSNNNKKGDNEYDPKFLVDNFYGNISTNMKKAVDRYRNFRRNKEEFAETYDKLKLLKSKIEKSQKVLDAANKKIATLDSQAKNLNSQISSLSDSRDDIRIELDILRRTKRHIENDNLRLDDDVNKQLILRLRKDLNTLFEKGVYADIDLGLLVKQINSIKLDEVDRELAVVNPESNKTILEVKRREIKAKMDACKDECDDVIPEKQEEYNLLRKELISIKKQIDVTSEEAPTDLKLVKIFNYSYLVANVDSIMRTIKALKEHIIERKVQYIEEVNEILNSVEAKFTAVEEKISGLKNQIKSINDSINEIQERDDVQDIQENKSKLVTEINKFFRDFEIAEPYKDIEEALTIIKKRWDELENDYVRKEQENKEKIPMYEKISNYLSMEDVIEADRKEYTKDLFDNANVFGITCTSNDRFSGKNVDALSEYNIDDIDIKSVGIDVVIIDEVSKSSFIDLLIPILYGKTVILVGDHRQLPPMYEFSKLRDDDFEGLDENIINKEINKRFTDLYEECFFKTLFERIPESYKTMLVQQYRCHEHIMNVFNHFYQGELKLGFAGQNNTKKHNVKLISNGRSIIEPDKHIYFVDCKKNETHEQDSTSMYNTGEARVVAELIRKLNDYFKRNPDREKLSIGVICTYGDQARKIKEVLKSEKVKTDAFKTDVEKMIVSTVDDFQGDERDIIILSTVRNPENPAKSNPGFILAYQRINVALSRARRMLIMVGNRRYLESKDVIDLPDVNGRGNDRRNFRVYKKILYTIEQYGKVVDDIDVLEDKETRING
ncbi:MAG: AAA domain-containing protein [Roseburia sp.]|nr:AAA domain-containing protein [Anaeroplasma bactoclasticum]MCM1196066.1 AAA domain-containing protein [Roseburia sp.]